MPPLHVNASPPGYRVVVDGIPALTTAVLDKARELAQTRATYGAYCVIEQRRRTGALWSLIEVYEPRKRGHYIVRDPHRE